MNDGDRNDDRLEGGNSEKNRIARGPIARSNDSISVSLTPAARGGEGRGGKRRHGQD